MLICGLVSGSGKHDRHSAFDRLAAAAQTGYGTALDVVGESATALMFASPRTQVLRGETATLAMSGYCTASEADIIGLVEDNFRTLAEAPAERVLQTPVTIASSLGGTHTLVAMNSTSAAAWGSRPGCAPPYVLHRDGAVVVCSRPGVLKHAFGLAPDPDYWNWVAGLGYPLDDTTPLAGVKAVVGGTALRIRGGDSALVDYILPPHGNIPRTPDEAAQAEETARQELLRAVSPVTRYDDVVLRLSGGKDSRFVASALHAIGANCLTNTSGRREGEIARKITRIGGWEFESSIVTPEDADSADLEERVMSAMRLSDGYIPLHAHNSLHSKDYLEDSHDAVVVGQIELHKGGFAKGRQNVDTQRARMLYEKKEIPPNIRNRDKLTRYMADLYDYDQYEEPLDIFYFPYTRARASRYLEVGYLRTSRVSLPIFPPNDERMFLAVSNIDRKRRASEEFMYGVIEKNSPEMARVPVFDTKWQFQSQDMAHRAPLLSADKTREQPRQLLARNSTRTFMTQHIRSNPLALEIAQRNVDDDMLFKCGLIDSEPDGFQPLGRNNFFKTFTRLFMISVAMSRWDEI